MPNTRSAQKQLRQNVKRRLRNRGRKARMRTAATRYQEALQAGELDTATVRLQEAVSLVDKGAKHHLLHPNAAARRKSRLMKRLNAVQAAQAAAAAE